MDKLVKELKTISSPDKFGLVFATIIIVFSFFSQKLDGLLAFLFGSSLFLIFTGMSFNRNVKTQVHHDGNIKNTYTEDILYLKNFPTISKVFFWIGGIVLIIFFVRLFSILFS